MLHLKRHSTLTHTRTRTHKRKPTLLDTHGYNSPLPHLATRPSDTLRLLSPRSANVHIICGLHFESICVYTTRAALFYTNPHTTRHPLSAPPRRRRRPHARCRHMHTHTHTRTRPKTATTAPPERDGKLGFA